MPSRVEVEGVDVKRLAQALLANTLVDSVVGLDDDVQMRLPFASDSLN